LAAHLNMAAQLRVKLGDPKPVRAEQRIGCHLRAP
jgi:hypothetical protein